MPVHRPASRFLKQEARNWQKSRLCFYVPVPQFLCPGTLLQFSQVYESEQKDGGVTTDIFVVCVQRDQNRPTRQTDSRHEEEMWPIPLPLLLLLLLLPHGPTQVEVIFCGGFKVNVNYSRTALSSYTSPGSDHPTLDSRKQRNAMLNGRCCQEWNSIDTSREPRVRSMAAGRGMANLANLQAKKRYGCDPRAIIVLGSVEGPLVQRGVKSKSSKQQTVVPIQLYLIDDKVKKQGASNLNPGPRSRDPVHSMAMYHSISPSRLDVRQRSLVRAQRILIPESRAQNLAALGDHDVTPVHALCDKCRQNKQTQQLLAALGCHSGPSVVHF
jgi:hypothetical protein